MKQLVNANKFLLGCIIFSLTIAIFSQILNTLRIMHIANTAHLNLLLNLTCSALIIIFGLFYFYKLNFFKSEIILFLILSYVAIFTSYKDRNIEHIAIDFLRPLVFILTASTLRSLLNIETLKNSKLIHNFFKFIVIFSFVLIIFCILFFIFVRPIYFSFTTLDSLLGLGWLLGGNNTMGAIVYSLILFLSGKRGVYISAILLMLYFFRKNRKLLLAYLITLSASVIFYTSLPLSKGIDNKLNAHGETTPQVTTDKLFSVISGGRYDEIKNVYSTIDSPYTLIFGKGLGFSYPQLDLPNISYSLDNSEPSDERRNLHFSPASVLIYYGAPFFLIFYFYLASTLFNILRLTYFFSKHRVELKSRRIFYTFSFFYIASLIFSLTEYSLFVYASCAISLGCSQAYIKKYLPIYKHEKNINHI